MLKSLEDYLSGLSFEPPEMQGSKRELDAGERAFVEKYLGQDTLERMAIQNPEPVPLPELAPSEIPAGRDWKPAQEIVVATPVLQIAPEAKMAPTIVVAPEKPAIEIATSAPVEAQALRVAPEKIAETIEAPVLTETAAEAPVAAQTGAKADTAVEAAQETLQEAAVETELAVKVAQESVQETRTIAETELRPESAVVATAPAEQSEREKLRQAAQIQVVSFFVAGQIFLLPVIGIQEVLRHMELVKVPQAPEFIAGAINLRGTVMPLVHLSALLTNSSSWTYDERSFIIVTGDPEMQMGLIIDKVSSMHMIPQQKIIWNVESRLGEAGEFLNALVDLDDRVCGLIAPEIIKQKLFSEFNK